MNATFRNVMGLTLLASGIMIAQAAQKTFDTPDAAVGALIAAVKSGNTDEMTAVLGEDMKDQFRPGDPVLADLDRAEFLQAAQAATKIENDTVPGRMIVYVGANEWPFPAPLVKDGDAWRFDGKAGHEEVLDRRIGHNEMHAVETCLGYVEAQIEYARTDHDGNGVLEFAQRLISSPGRHDGLYWPDAAAGQSPLGPSLNESDRLVSQQPDSGVTPARTHHHFGYHFRVLTAQGGNAVGGAHNFLVDGHLVGGFALIAWPREYGTTGVQTFMVNQLGVVYAKDLGADTATLAPAIAAFDPDAGWKKIDPSN
jgi:Protein of unknown function (DUF2950)